MAGPDSRIVLLPVDGSDHADSAFEWYLKNMRQPNDYVFGVTAPEYTFSGISAVSLFGPLADHQAITNEFQEQHKKTEKLCADYTARLRSVGVKGQVDAVSGNKPGILICEHADRVKANVVVMGSRGLSPIKKLVMGSVSTFVLQNAGIPVTIIPIKKD